MSLEFINKFNLDFHPELRSRMLESMKMLDLESGWNDYGPGGRHKIQLERKVSNQSWKEALTFLYDCANHAFNVHGELITVPDILPEVIGGVDLFWEDKNDFYKFLISFPHHNSEGSISFYGDNEDGLEIKGILHPLSHHIVWDIIKILNTVAS